MSAGAANPIPDLDRLEELAKSTLTATANGGDAMRFQDALTPAVVLSLISLARGPGEGERGIG